MIASSLYNSSSATGVMEQNLDRLTVIMAVVFAVCVVLCMFFFPQVSSATKHEPHKYLKRVPQVRDLFVYIFVTEPKYPHILRPTKEILDR